MHELHPHDQSEWLHRLGAGRPRDGAALTQEILDLAGPPPASQLPGTAAYGISLRLIPLLADDLCKRAALRTRRLRESGAAQAELDDSAAEARFWGDVRDWANGWDGALPVVYAPAPAPRMLIPRQLARTV